MFDTPKKYSELMAECGSKDKMVEKLLSRCNELGVMDLSEHIKEQTK